MTSNLVRKFIATLNQIPRAIALLSTSRADYRVHPPVLVNSFPKSGTHLLLQIASAIPDLKYYGSFIASTPSISMTERTELSYRFAICRIVPSEVIPAHLYHKEEIAELLERKNTVHYFIYRDLRDVAVSEAKYLAHMSRFHRLHGQFKRLGSEEERVSAAILGLTDLPPGVEYPDIAARFSRYSDWLTHPSVCSLTFEALMSEARDDELRRLVDHYNSMAKHDVPLGASVQSMHSAIDPTKSHTYRKGEVGGWREVFTERNKGEMKRVAGQLLIKLGYERDLDW